MKEKMKKSKKGFTLVELIVVIAIIGVLAMLITPSIMGYVNKSKISRNEANAKTIAMAAQAVNADLIEPAKGGTVTFGATGWARSASPATPGSGAGGATFVSEITKMTKPQGTANIVLGADGAVTFVAYAPTGAPTSVSAATTTGTTASEVIGYWKN